jgi:hypothetical protein
MVKVKGIEIRHPLFYQTPHNKRGSVLSVVRGSMESILVVMRLRKQHLGSFLMAARFSMEQYVIGVGNGAQERIGVEELALLFEISKNETSRSMHMNTVTRIALPVPPLSYRLSERA